MVEKLREQGAKQIFIARSRDYDLTKEESAARVMQNARPDIVVHLAGMVGGILANKMRPAEFFYNNLMMGTHVIHQAWRHGAQKVVSAGAGCGYPENAPMPQKETDFWDGFPQKDSSSYSLAKRMLHVQSVAYYEQYGFVSIVTVPGNIYGPYDNFDLTASHVVPALVRKFADAAEEGLAEVEVWGTGRPTRDFVYAGDVAEGILLAVEKYDRPELVNLSSGVETSIRELVETTQEVTGYKGRVVWNKDRPDGQVRRVFDVSKAERDLGFHARTTLRAGIEETVAWYRANRAAARLTV
jgi:GDP-L-fucose synthase